MLNIFLMAIMSLGASAAMYGLIEGNASIGSTGAFAMIYYGGIWVEQRIKQ